MKHGSTLSDNHQTQPRTVLLIGNPNVGKSVIFGALTGRYVTVSNYPGTTVEITSGRVHMHGEVFHLTDTPGINNLLPMSEDEQVTRNILLSITPHSIIQVIDAKNLRRGLLITVQLAEMGIPFTVVLNMMDEALHRSIEIDIHELERTLGVPVLPTVATQRKGLKRVQECISQTDKSRFHVHYSEPIEKTIRLLEPLLPPCPFHARSLALMFLAADPTLTLWLRERSDAQNMDRMEQIRTGLEYEIPESLAYRINRERLHVVDTLVARTLKKTSTIESALYTGIHRWSTHAVYGIPFLLVVLAAMYLFVGRFGAGICVDYFQNVIFGNYINPWSIKLVHKLIPLPFFQDLLVGPYGAITMAMTYAVAIVLPIVGTFFIAFGILEDSGYLPRLAIMMNRVFRTMGLNGKAVLPMILGLGCDTMATITARILESHKERVIVTLLLALGVPCSAQLGVILAMLGDLSLKATLLWVGVVVLIILTVGYLASKVIPGRGAEFVLEIPPLRIPKLNNVLVKTVARIEWYLKEAVPLFIVGTLILFLFDRYGILKGIEEMSAPVVVTFLGLPAKTAEAFLIGFLRRDYGAAGLFALARAGELNPVQVVVSLVTITLFVPCIANVFIIVKERGWRMALAIMGFIFPFAFLVGGVLNQVLILLRVQL